MEIPSFERLYFINDMVSVRNNLCEIHAHVDVLTTWGAQLRNLSCIVSNQENKWNLYLNDGTLRTQSNPIIYTRAFPNALNNDTYVLAVAGKYNAS